MKLSVDGQNYSSTDDLGYINLPILLKYRKDGFAAFLWPQISYLLSAKSKGEGINGSQDSKTTLSGSAGYLRFFEKGGGKGVSFIPVLRGFQYHFVPEIFI